MHLGIESSLGWSGFFLPSPGGKGSCPQTSCTGKQPYHFQWYLVHVVAQQEILQQGSYWYVNKRRGARSRAPALSG